MGLDMYLEGEIFYMDKRDQVEGHDVKETKLDLGYWRKHPNLHGYIVQTMCNGKDECEPVPLDLNDLVHLKDAVMLKKLPHTEGFFFGKSDLSDEQIKEDLETLDKAINFLKRADIRKEIRTVYYRASW